jgi:predicted RNA-binding Zn-ribbon protein involved in translation (DUF1610 family)
MAYHTNNIIQGNLTPKTHNHKIFSATGVHKLECPNCGKAHIGQTGKTSSKDIMNTYAPSETIVIAQNLPNISMNICIPLDPWKTLHKSKIIKKKAPHLNTIERFYTNKEASSESQLSDKQIIFPNKICDAILNIRI